MGQLFEEFLIGNLPKKTSLEYSGRVIGPGEHLAIDLSPMEKEFNKADVRAMSRGGLALRYLTKNLILRLQKVQGIEFCSGEAMGVYSMAHDGGLDLSFLPLALNNSQMKPSEIIRSWSPKLSLSVASGLISVQIAIEAKAHGPVLTVQPGEHTADLIVSEIALDWKNGLLEQCFVGFSMTYEDVFEWPDGLSRLFSERVAVFYLQSIDDNILEQLRIRLKEFNLDKVRQ